MEPDSSEPENMDRTGPTDSIESPHNHSSPEPKSYWCDRCSVTISGPRHHCEQCNNFDYCHICFADAAFIHPGHSFISFSATAAAKGPPTKTDEEAPEALNGPERQHDTKCRSCAPVTECLPSIPLAFKDKKANRGQEVFIEWRLRLSRLIEATQRGCAFCAFVLDGFFRSNNGEMFSTVPKKPWFAEPERHEEKRMKLVNHCMGTLTRLKTDRFVFVVSPLCTRGNTELPDFDKIRISLDGKTEKIHTMAELKEARVFHSAGIIKIERDVFAANGNIASEHLSSRPPNAAPGSQKAMDQFREWMRHCDEHHGDACRPRGSGTLPSRVIDVSQSEVGKLILHTAEPGEQGTYAALSYCWGGPQSFQTTSSTIADREEGFSLDDLPRTLREAVQVTNSLGIQYLWIDSICIVQDERGDKLHEMSKMGSIYKFASITICAAMAESADAGFLDDTSDPETGLWKNMIPMAYYMPTTNTSFDDAMQAPKRQGGTIWISSEQMHVTRSHKDSVSHRAWCLQERVLSPRLLSFSRWPTWRCSQLVASDGAFYCHNGKHDSQDRRFTAALTKSRGNAFRTDVFGTMQLLEAWRYVVEDYTKRELSLESDRLPALGGVAREMSHLTGMRYMAGLWENNLLQDLMWHTNAKEWLARPVKWRAPSWSWASVDSPVLYDAVTSDSTATAQVLDCQVASAAGATEFEEVTSGSVSVRGPFAEIALADFAQLLRRQAYAPAPPISKDVQEWYALLSAHMEISSKQNLSDEEVEASLPDRVFALLLFTRDWMQDRWDPGMPKKMKTCYSGLILRKAGNGSGNYERIGSFCNDDEDVFDQIVHPWAEKTVQLV